METTLERKHNLTCTTNIPSLDKYNWLLHLQHVRGEVIECKNFIKKHIETQFTKHEYSLYKQGVILREEGQIQSALHLFQTCYQLDRNNCKYAKEVAKCLFSMSKFHLSLEAYLEAERVSDEEPDWEIYQNIAECYMHLENSNNAKDYARKAIQFGKQEDSYFLLTRIFDLEGDIQSAIAVSTAALRCCPDNIEMITQLGMLYLRQRETQLAFENFTTALEIDPECTKALLGVGSITQAHGEYDVALSKYKIALKNNSESVALWNNIGLCFFSKQKYVAAITCLKRALWISPLNWKVLFNLGLIHLNAEQTSSAFNFLCAAINIRPDVSFCFTAIGYALLELQDLENSLKAFEQAEIISPKKASIKVNVCICLYLNGLYNKALTKINELLSMETTESLEDKEAFKMGEKLLHLLKNQQKSDTMDNGENSKKEINSTGIEEEPLQLLDDEV